MELKWRPTLNRQGGYLHQVVGGQWRLAASISQPWQAEWDSSDNRERMRKLQEQRWCSPVPFLLRPHFIVLSSSVMFLCLILCLFRVNSTSPFFLFSFLWNMSLWPLLPWRTLEKRKQKKKSQFKLIQRWIFSIIYPLFSLSVFFTTFLESVSPYLSRCAFVVAFGKCWGHFWQWINSRTPILAHFHLRKNKTRKTFFF